jgi:hypothetical protein
MLDLHVKVVPVLIRRFMSANRTEYLLRLHIGELLLDILRYQIIYFSGRKRKGHRIQLYGNCSFKLVVLSICMITASNITSTQPIRERTTLIPL